MNPQIDKKLLWRLFWVKLFDRCCRLWPWRELAKVLREAGETGNSEFFFIQIGANDGVIYDPIFSSVKRYGWRGILVEPVPHYFQKLKQNYAANTNLIFENIAISSEAEGAKDFYRIGEGYDFLPQWCHGLGTFHREVLLTHRWAIPNLEDYIVREKVHCIAWHTLLQRHHVETVNLLVIDTEGHDHIILQQIDFARLKPRILIYEHQYIEAAERQSCETLLKAHGYRISKHLGNTLARLHVG